MPAAALPRIAPLAPLARAWRQGPLVRALMLTGVAVVVLQAVPELPVRPLIVTTASVPRGLYLLRDDVQDLRRGEMVAFEYRSPDWAAGRYLRDRSSIAKYILAVPGEQLRRDEHRLEACPPAGECRDLGLVATHDSAGRPMQADLDGVTIPADQYYMGSQARGSYDSRYYGLIPVDRIAGRITPLITY